MAIEEANCLNHTARAHLLEHSFGSKMSCAPENGKPRRPCQTYIKIVYDSRIAWQEYTGGQNGHRCQQLPIQNNQCIRPFPYYGIQVAGFFGWPINTRKCTVTLCFMLWLCEIYDRIGRQGQPKLNVWFANVHRLIRQAFGRTNRVRSQNYLSDLFVVAPRKRCQILNWPGQSCGS